MYYIILRDKSNSKNELRTDLLRFSVCLICKEEVKKVTLFLNLHESVLLLPYLLFNLSVDCKHEIQKFLKLLQFIDHAVQHQLK